MAGGGARACRGELNSARGWERSGEGGRERLLRGPKGEERGEGASELKKWRTARLSALSPWRIERLREKPGTGEGRGLGTWPTAPACGGEHRRHGEKQRGRDGVRAIW